MRITYSEVPRPIQEAIVAHAPVLCQRGRSGFWYARTQKQHPSPEGPRHVWGMGDTKQAALDDIGASIKFLRTLDCFSAEFALAAAHTSGH